MRTPLLISTEDIQRADPRTLDVLAAAFHGSQDSAI